MIKLNLPKTYIWNAKKYPFYNPLILRVGAKIEIATYQPRPRSIGTVCFITIRPRERSADDRRDERAFPVAVLANKRLISWAGLSIVVCTALYRPWIRLRASSTLFFPWSKLVSALEIFDWLPNISFTCKYFNPFWCFWKHSEKHPAKYI